MLDIELHGADIDAIRRLITEVGRQFASVEDPRFQAKATVLAQELPRSVRHTLNQFRLEEPDAVCVISGYPLDDMLIDDTPKHWRKAIGRSDVREWEFFFFLTSCLLG